MYDVIAGGGFWGAARRHEAMYRADDCCPMCGKAGADVWHTFWDCEYLNAEPLHEATAMTAHVTPPADREEADASLWYRGLLPFRWREWDTR